METMEKEKRILFRIVDTAASGDESECATASPGTAESFMKLTEPALESHEFQEWQDEISDRLDRLLFLEKRGDTDRILRISAALYPLCTHKKARLSYLMRSRLSRLGSLTIYLGILNGLLEPEEAVLNRLEELCAEAPPGLLTSISEKNPLYLLSKLYIYGFFNDLSPGLPPDEKYQMLSMAVSPETFFYSGFRGEWWPFLSVGRIRKSILRSRRKSRIVEEKLKAYLKNCPGDETEPVKSALEFFAEGALRGLPDS